MQILRFEGNKIHGYLRFDIGFRPDMTFLVGANGSGKTSVVRSIHALLAPQIRTLIETAHTRMMVKVRNGSEEISVTSANFKETLVLRVSGVTDPLTVAHFKPPLTEPSYRWPEFAETYYATLQVEHQNHDVIRALRTLPTPMFLGLERRAILARRGPFRRTPTRSTAATIGTPNRSLADTNELAAEAYRDAMSKENELTNELRLRLIGRAFHFTEAGGEGRFPSKLERQKIEQQKEMVETAVESLGKDAGDLAKQVRSYFTRLGKLLSNLPDSGTMEDVFNKPNVNRRRAQQAAMDWFVNQGQYVRIQEIAGDVEEFVEERRKTFAEVDAYKSVVNKFLNDTGKEILIGPSGLNVKTPDGDERPVSALSSGEQQIVVLLTHLAFNPDAKRAGVLIIDEPELSLHVNWQEKFADSVTATNPRLQVILATHSPSIILDRVDHCVDLQQ